jgi:hypothetical protein
VAIFQGDTKQSTLAMACLIRLLLARLGLVNHRFCRGSACGRADSDNDSSGLSSMHHYLNMHIIVCPDYTSALLKG